MKIIFQRLMLCLIAAAAASIAGPAYAADGALDAGFGSGGQVRTDFAGHDRASAIAVQPDGKIVTAGMADWIVGQDLVPVVGLVRYNVDGSLDATFGSGGRVALPSLPLWPSTPDQREGVALALQSDGRIVIAATEGELYSPSNFGVARVMPNGALDPSFGNGAGWVVTSFTDPQAVYASASGATSVAIQPDGRIVAAGFVWLNGGYSDVALVRYNANGTLDSTFGGTGRVAVDFEGIDDWANGVAIQADGKIVAAGATLDANYRHAFGVVRVDASGIPDPTFGNNGRVRTVFLQSGEPFAEANALVIQSSGKIVVAGVSFDNVSGPSIHYFDFALARYDTHGALDATFGNGGLVATDLAGGSDIARAIAIQADSKLVVAGGRADASNLETHGDFALVRYSADGAIDTWFGAGGWVTTSFDGYDSAQAIAIQSDCKIVLAGYTWVVEPTQWGGESFGDAHYAIARYDGGQCGSAPPPIYTCPLSQGYWNGHPAVWPVSSLVLGTQTYSKTELRSILAASTAGDASLVLAQQLIAAKLNVAMGADPTPIVATMTHADGLLGAFAGKLPYKVKPSSPSGQAMTIDAKKLESYNLGQLTLNCYP